MATGKQQHQDYLDALQRLGRELTRRAGSRCELSGETGKLLPFDLEGPSREPALDHVVLVSEQVARWLDGPLPPANQLRFLEPVVWSDCVAVRRAALQILARIDEPWAIEAVDNAAWMDNANDELNGHA